MIAGAEGTVFSEHETAGGAAVPFGAAFTLVETRDHAHAFALALGSFSRGEALVTGLGQLDIAFLAVQLLE